MYIVVRIMKVKKGFENEIIEKFSKPSIIQKSPGYIKSELLFDKKNDDFDIFKTYIYFENKKAYYVWQGSPEHIAMHKKRANGEVTKEEYILEVSKEVYDLVGTKEKE